MSLCFRGLSPSQWILQRSSGTGDPIEHAGGEDPGGRRAVDMVQGLDETKHEACSLFGLGLLSQPIEGGHDSSTRRRTAPPLAAWGGSVSVMTSTGFEEAAAMARRSSFSS